MQQVFIGVQTSIPAYLSSAFCAALRALFCSWPTASAFCRKRKDVASCVDTDRVDHGADGPIPD